MRSKSPFSKGGFRGIFKRLAKIPPDPPLRKGGMNDQVNAYALKGSTRASRRRPLQGRPHFLSAQPRVHKTVSKPSAGEKSCYVGWPGGHCLQVPKEQEVPAPGPSPMPNPLPNGVTGSRPLVAPRPGRITSGPPKQNRSSPGSTILAETWVLKHPLTP